MPNRTSHWNKSIIFQPLTQKYVLCFMIYMLHFWHSKIVGFFLFDSIYFKDLKNKSQNYPYNDSKVKIFWESPKNLAHLPHFIWHYLVASNYKWKTGQIFVAFSEYLNFTQQSSKWSKKLWKIQVEKIFDWFGKTFLTISISKIVVP